MQKQNCNTVIVLYMGGTFGCVGNPLTPMPASDFLPKLQSLIQQQQEQQLLTQDLMIECRVATVVKDSAICDASDWLNLALMLQDLCKQGFKRFVLIHGTDTLSYAAALLSRLLGQQLKLIITGSQQPLFESSGQLLHPHSDAWLNLKFALQQFLNPTQGCFVAFANQLIDAPQSFKLQRNAWQAFANTRTQIVLGSNPSLGKTSSKKSQLNINPTDIERVKKLYIATIVILPLQPHASLTQLRSLLSHPPDFLIVQAFGCGNLALSTAHIECLNALSKQNCLCVLSSQVPFGQLQQIYAINEQFGSFQWLIDNSAGPADLYAKIVQMYLQYASVDERRKHWYE